jgi:hypothetical protein
MYQDQNGNWQMPSSGGSGNSKLVAVDTPPTGYSKWGGGKGPTGLTNSPGVKSPVLNRKVVNHAHYVVIDANGIPKQAQGVAFPAGASVTVRAHNGTSAGNSDVVRIGHSYDELTSSQGGDPITPDSEISWPANTGAGIFIVGTKGDGIRVSVQAGRQI